MRVRACVRAACSRASGGAVGAPGPKRRVCLGEADGGAGVVVVCVAAAAFGRVGERLQVCEEACGVDLREPGGDGGSGGRVSLACLLSGPTAQLNCRIG